jgi:hypothetical protein
MTHEERLRAMAEWKAAHGRYDTQSEIDACRAGAEALRLLPLALYGDLCRSKTCQHPDCVAARALMPKGDEAREGERAACGERDGAHGDLVAIVREWQAASDAVMRSVKSWPDDGSLSHRLALAEDALLAVPLFEPPPAAPSYKE